jgi:hypothetical protein
MTVWRMFILLRVLCVLDPEGLCQAMSGQLGPPRIVGLIGVKLDHQNATIKNEQASLTCLSHTRKKRQELNLGARSYRPNAQENE